ncbi:lytic transglycosylase domain-containing protein [Jannaschia rubra]|uniref:Soluble lytic murein transglycosylase n=1 Tax=Jannaschia rubra TaxID=282197 RepID=A0A0M6XUF5_9RHOB|nr:lytic transglycosylase domain-containing protein [Jannaschia rubra]CTQ33851.1 Soluble lytic murein transglycosylase precursor [Jannaschia rubra]SFG10827.1 Transglycosylase SLT domain-containing protein [Jannaschia rubra]
MTKLLHAALVAGLSLSLPAGPATADFTFKRSPAPQPGTTARIDIQVDEEAFRAQTAPRPLRPRLPQVAALSADTPAGPAKAATGQQDWFWTTVSPGIEPVAGRFLQAAELAARPPQGSGIAAPTLNQLQGIARVHGREILARSVGTRVSPALVLALISVESGGRVTAVSNKGATGLMQIIPATAERFGITDSNDPAQNIRAGVAYLDWLMGEFGNDPVLALAGYNAGEGAVHRNGGVPPYAETRAYVPKVMAAWNVARLMCRTPPQLPGDGCVFDPSLVDS